MRGSLLLGVFALVTLLGACSTPAKFSMYPNALTTDDCADPDMALVLVSIRGPNPVNYFQFTHSSLPAINVRFNGQTETIVAVPMPVGLREVQLSTYTFANQPGLYLPNGLSFGFNAVRTRPVNIDKRGLYYLGSLSSGVWDETPLISNDNLLVNFRKKFPHCSNLPVVKAGGGNV